MIKTKSHGFTLLELITIIAIIGILSAVAIPTYQYFLRKSQSSEILLSYDAIRSSLEAELALGQVNDCSELQDVVTVSLGHEYTDLSLGFEAVGGQNNQGYYPVLQVCASTDQQGVLGVDVARAAHDEFVLTNTVSPGAVLTDALVSFAVPAGNTTTAACMVPVASTATGSGCGQSGQPQAQPATTPPAQQPAQPPAQQPVTQGGLPQTPDQATAAVADALQAVPAAARQAASDVLALVDRSPALADALRQALATGTPDGIPGPNAENYFNSCPGTESTAFIGNDVYAGDCSTDFPGLSAAAGYECVIPPICPVTCGVSAPSSPEVLEALKAKHYASVMALCYGSSISNTFRPSDPNCQELQRLQAAGN